MGITFTPVIAREPWVKAPREPWAYAVAETPLTRKTDAIASDRMDFSGDRWVNYEVPDGRFHLQTFISTMTLRATSSLFCAVLMLMTGGCKKDNPPADTAAADSTPRDEGWIDLFDGSSMAAWRGYKKDSMPSGWRIQDGTLTKDTVTGDIITREQFGDFELELEWKLGEHGNSGLFYRGTEEYEFIYWSAPEYQLLDDATAPPGETRLTSAGAAYALYPSPEGVLKPAGEWNAARIVVQGNHVEHWMNGQKLLEYDLGSPDWAAKVKGSKFAEWANYGKASAGHVGIQGDHEGTLALRNIRIRRLGATPGPGAAP
jgi:hypothetical protein